MTGYYEQLRRQIQNLQGMQEKRKFSKLVFSFHWEDDRCLHLGGTEEEKVPPVSTT